MIDNTMCDYNKNRYSMFITDVSDFQPVVRAYHIYNLPEFYVFIFEKRFLFKYFRKRLKIVYEKLPVWPPFYTYIYATSVCPNFTRETNIEIRLVPNKSLKIKFYNYIQSNLMYMRFLFIHVIIIVRIDYATFEHNTYCKNILTNKALFESLPA